MNPRIEQVQNLPLHRHLGIGPITAADGRGTLSVVVTDTILNPAGMLHGGVVYLLCDVCAYAGLLSRIDEETEAVTHDIHVSMLRSVPHGATVTFASEITKLGKSLCFITVTATCADRLVATARITKSMMR